MENKIQGVIFDLDGVLVHTDELHFRAWSALARELNIPFDRSDNDRLRGVSRRESLELLLGSQKSGELTAQEKADLCERKNEMYRESLMSLTPQDVPLSTRELLASLRVKGIRLAVGSSSQNAPLILERIDLATAFDAVVDGSMLSAAKPDPEVFLRAATLLHLPPSVCAVVEDAPAGILAARRAGMVAIGVGSYATSAEPDVWLSTLEQLPDWL